MSWRRHSPAGLLRRITFGYLDEDIHPALGNLCPHVLIQLGESQYEAGL